MTEAEAAILDYAEACEHGTGLTPREVLGVSPTRYTQQLLALIARDDIERERPMLVHRIRRLTRERSEARAQRRFRRA